MTDAGWPSEWMRGVLTLLVLRTLAPGPTYGYAVASALEGQGFGTVKGGTLYPLLARLEGEGLITSRWRPGEGGPGRKYFSLTAAGTRHLDGQMARWDQFTALVAHTLHEHDARPPQHEDPGPETP